MNRIKVIVSGSRGKVGREVVALIRQSDHMELIGEWNRGMNHQRTQFPDRAVVIDFSAPEHFMNLLKVCEDPCLPVVSGTTGLTGEHFALMEKLSQRLPLLWSPNMSPSMATMVKMLKLFSALSDKTDFQIEEWHHRHKKDAPSGTALWLQRELKRAVNKPIPHPLSIRGGGIFGMHKVVAMMDEEVISLEHTVLNRTVFARGAVMAASWLIHQKPGFYSMIDTMS